MTGSATRIHQDISTPLKYQWFVSVYSKKQSLISLHCFLYSWAYKIVIFFFNGKKSNPSEEMHMLQQKAVSHCKTVDHVTVYCYFRTGDMAPYSAILIHTLHQINPHLHLNATFFWSEFLSVKILRPPCSIICLTGPQQCIFLPCKLSHKSGEEIIHIQIMSTLVLSLLHLQLSLQTCTYYFYWEKIKSIWGVAYVIIKSCNTFWNYTICDSSLLSPDQSHSYT
jgi:hypothetical protein